MILTPRQAFIGLLIFNAILVSIVVHLMFLLRKGADTRGSMAIPTGRQASLGIPT